MRASIRLKDGGSAKDKKAGGGKKNAEGHGGVGRNKRIAQCTQQCTGSPYKHKKKRRREEERESAREKIELNSLILNYYLSIMGGMEPGCCAGED